MDGGTFQKFNQLGHGVGASSSSKRSREEQSRGTPINVPSNEPLQRSYRQPGFNPYGGRPKDNLRASKPSGNLVSRQTITPVHHRPNKKQKRESLQSNPQSDDDDVVEVRDPSGSGKDKKPATKPDSKGKKSEKRSSWPTPSIESVNRLVDGKDESHSHEPDSDPIDLISASKELDEVVDGTAHNLGDDSIEDFSDSTPPPPPSNVQSQYRDASKQGKGATVSSLLSRVQPAPRQGEIQPPLIDLVAAQQKRPNRVSSSMKGRATQKNILDKRPDPHAFSMQKPPQPHDVATAPTHFYGDGKSRDPQRCLRLKEWYLGVGAGQSSLDGQSSLVLNPQRTMISVRNGLNAKERAVCTIMLKSDIDTVKYGPFEVPTIILRLKPHVREAKKLSNSPYYSPTETGPCGEIILQLDSLEEPAYEDLTRVLVDSVRDRHERLDSHALKAYLEMVERERNRLQEETVRQSNQSVTTLPLEHVSSSNESTSSNAETRETRSTRPRPVPNHRGSSNHQGGVPIEIPTRQSVRRPVRDPSPNPDEIFLVYPPTGVRALNIQYRDFKRLEPGEYLNDILIELGLKLWHDKLRDENPQLADDVHVFSSFFYKKLNQKNHGEAYKSVKSWTSKFDIFQKKYLVIPINENMHWYLAIICHPQYTLQPPPVKPPPRGERVSTRSQQSSVPFPFEPIQGTNSTRDTTALPIPGAFPSGPSGPRSTASEDEVAEAVVVSTRDPSEEGMELDTPSSTELQAGAPSEGNPLATELRYPEVMDVDVHPAEPPEQPHAPSGDAPASDVMEEEEEESKEDESTSGESGCTTILTFDSFGGKHPQAIATLKRYLATEAAERKQILETTPAQGKKVKVPIQPNYCDCGLYLLHFVEKFMSDPERFTQSILTQNKLGNKDVDLLWDKEVVSGKREAMKDTLQRMANEWKSLRSAQGAITQSHRDNEPSDVQQEGPNADVSTVVEDSSDDEPVLVEDVTPAPSIPSNKRKNRTVSEGPASRPRG